MIRVFCPEQVAVEDPMCAMGFAGNKPALPPLTTEMVESIFYLVEEDEPEN